METQPEETSDMLERSGKQEALEHCIVQIRKLIEQLLVPSELEQIQTSRATVDALFSLPHASLSLNPPADAPPELSPILKHAESSEPPGLVKKSCTASVNSPSEKGDALRGETRRISGVSAGRVEKLKEMRGRSPGAKSTISDDERLNVGPHFELREGWETINGSFFVSRNHRAFYTSDTSKNWNTVERINRFRQIWAGIACFLIARDCVAIPLMPFGTDLTFWAWEILAAIFWTLNLPMSCFLARSKATVWWLFLTNIFVDLALLAPTYIDLINSSHGYYSWQITLRVAQLGRLLQVPHWYRITGMAGTVREWLRHRSREFRAFWNIMWLGVLGCIFLHVITCAWFFWGQFPGGWVQEQEGFRDENWFTQYIRSFEWAISRLPPSHLPENMLLKTREERFLAIFGTSSTMLFGAIFTSFLTNDMSDIRRVRRQNKEAEFQVLDFSWNFSISSDLEDKARSCAEFGIIVKVHLYSAWGQYHQIKETSYWIGSNGGVKILEIIMIIGVGFVFSLEQGTKLLEIEFCKGSSAREERDAGCFAGILVWRALSRSLQSHYAAPSTFSYTLNKAPWISIQPLLPLPGRLVCGSEWNLVFRWYHLWADALCSSWNCEIPEDWSWGLSETWGEKEKAEREGFKSWYGSEGLDRVDPCGPNVGTEAIPATTNIFEILGWTKMAHGQRLALRALFMD